MSQITGRAVVFINSVKMGTVSGGTVRYGGEVREIVEGQFKPLGYKVSGVKPGGVDISIAHMASLDQDDYDVTDATVMVQMDSGEVVVITQATRTGDPPEIDVEAGTVSVTIEGQVAIKF